jgi:hypothetical protein
VIGAVAMAFPAAYVIAYVVSLPLQWAMTLNAQSAVVSSTATS